MILPGKAAISRGILLGLKVAAVQAGTVDFNNQFRAGSGTEQLELTGSPKSIHLSAGKYMVEFNDEVDVPLDIMGQIFVRSLLWRTGALLNAGVTDSGYKGTVGRMLQVVNSHGIILHENARLAQIVFQEMSENVDGYSGMYQGATGL